MFSPSKLQNKRPPSAVSTESGPKSPSKILASPLASLKTLLWSPSKESVAKENEDSNPTPSKRLKRDVEQCSSLITSSPQRNPPKVAPPSGTPKKKPVRNLNAEFSSSENKVDNDLQIYDEFASSNLVDNNKENLKQSRTQQILNTLFSPVFKQYHHLFGLTHTHTHTQTLTTPTTQFERVEKSKVCQIVTLPEEEEYSSQNAYLQLSLVELAANETLSDSPERKSLQSWTIQEETQDEVEEFEEEEEEEFDPFAFIASLPPLDPEYANRPAALPSRGVKHPHITLVLDLDETLVHCSTEPITQAHLTFPVVFNEIEYRVFVRQRPYFKQFLEEVSSKFEVVVFTASQEVYASKLLDIIDPEKKLIHHRLYRQSCVSVEGNFLKDLNVLGRDLSKVVIIDNSPQTFGYQLDNGIPIESWFEDPEDKELLELLPFLFSLQNVDDVRPHIRRKFNLHKKIEQAKLNMYSKKNKY